MPRPKTDVTGKRQHVYLPPKHLEIRQDIDNFSAFVQICLEQASDIMTYAILHDVDPKKYHHKRHEESAEEVIAKFNEKYPLDELTQKRLGTWHDPSQKIPDVLL